MKTKLTEMLALSFELCKILELKNSQNNHFRFRLDIYLLGHSSCLKRHIPRTTRVKLMHVKLIPYDGVDFEGLLLLF